jgi:hypothetical protein
VLLAVHWLRIDDVLKQGGDLSGKVIVSCSLPMNADDTGLVIGHTSSGAEELAKKIRHAKVVSAFGTVPSEVFFSVFDVRRRARRPSMAYCGDDDGAKDVAARLISDVGFEPVDAGPLRIARGPAGATIAYTLQARGKRVVLIEKGPFVCHGSMDTRGCADLMFDGDRAFTTSGGILIRSGETVGGGSTVNVDLAFSPLMPMIGRRIASWAHLGLIEPTLHTPECLMEAYEWVQTAIGTRSVAERDRNNNNQVLWNGAEGCGFNPQLYHLNRDETPTDFDWNDKRDAARQLLIDAMCDANNPLALIPNADAEIVLNQTTGVATGVRISINRSAWTGHGHTFVDPCGLGLAALPEGPCELRADAVIVAAGTLGSTRILLKAAAHFPEFVDNPAIGRGPVIHPSMVVVGRFAREIRLLEGLDSAVYVDALGLEPGVVLEAMSGLPEYGAMLTPGSGEDVLERLRDFQRLAGFGVMLVDEVSDNNRIALTSATTPCVDYSLSAGDRDRLAHGVSLAVKVMLRAGAEEVWLATNENILGASKHDPTRISVMKTPADADRLRERLHFITNRTILSASHLQASNKSGLSSATSVVSPRHRVWNMSTGEEIPNLYVMDSSMFPESVGANPMQTVYTFARIFAGALP